MCSVRAKTLIFCRRASLITSSSRSTAWLQNCPEWLWWEKGILILKISSDVEEVFCCLYYYCSGESKFHAIKKRAAKKKTLSAGSLISHQRTVPSSLTIATTSACNFSILRHDNARLRKKTASLSALGRYLHCLVPFAHRYHGLRRHDYNLPSLDDSSAISSTSRMASFEFQRSLLYRSSSSMVQVVYLFRSSLSRALEHMGNQSIDQR